MDWSNPVYPYPHNNMSTRGFFTLVHPEKYETKVFYYRKPDGSIFTCGEREAYLIQTKYAQVGYSDGSLFKKLIGDAIIKQMNDVADIDNLLEDEEITKVEWKRKRQKIADEARKALEDAIVAEEDNARGNLVKPGNKNITVEGGELSQIQSRLNNLM